MKHLSIEGALRSPVYALVDDDDYDFLAKYKWRARDDGYAVRYERQGCGRQIPIYMHRAVLNFPRGFDVDHIDGNRLNNQKSNLRVVTKQQNQFNRGAIKGSASRFKGVSRYKKDEIWRASIRINGKTEHLGLFNTEEEAAAAYNAVAKLLHGEYARLNPVSELSDWQSRRVCKRSGGASKYLGVYPQNNKWKAAIRHDGKHIHIGMFDDEILAAKAYNAVAISLKGIKAKLNAV